MKKTIAIIWLVLLCGSVGFADSGYAVLVQQSPEGAGEIEPGIGVHNFGQNQTITLSTVAKNGYHFVCWLGDVSDPTANRTMLDITGPKIVIAVFQRDTLEFNEGSATVSRGATKLTPSKTFVSNSGFSPATSSGRTTPTPTPEPIPIPEPVPEPAAVITLSAAAILAKLKANKTNRHQEPGPRNP